MIRIDGIEGNVRDDEALAARRADHADAGTLERIVIDVADRRKSRLRVETDAGTDLGVVVDRPALASGDVLLADEDRMIVVAFEPREALAVELPDPTGDAVADAVDLGHRVGNQHWDLAVADGVAYVPLEADRRIVERVVADALPGAETRVETVEAERFLEGDERSHDRPHGGERGHEHDHSHGGEHDHSREGAHEHHDHDH